MAGIFTPMAMKTLKRFTLAGLQVKSLIEGGGPIDQFNFNAIYGIFVNELTI